MTDTAQSPTLNVFEASRDWALAAGLKVRADYDTDSTNRVAKEDDSDSTKPVLKIGAEVSLPTIYLAARQTKGRGRGTNTWEADVNSALLASWSFAMAKPPQPVLAPQVGLALFEAAGEAWPGVEFSLKAPNDLYIGDKKVAGLLIETVDWGQARRSVIGLGFNVLSPPASIATATDLRAHLGPEGVTLQRWQIFLTKFSGLLHAAMIQGQEAEIQVEVQERLRAALNRFPLLKEPIDRVDELGQLHSQTRVVYWHQL